MNLRDKAYLKYFFGDSSQPLTGEYLEPEVMNAYVKDYLRNCSVNNTTGTTK